MKHKTYLLLLASMLLLFTAIPLTAQEGGMPDPVGLRPDSPQYALHGPYWVGTMEFVIEDENRPLPVTVWYPALNDSGSSEYAVYDMGIADLWSEEASQINDGQALRDAEVDFSAAPYPLVIVSSGLGASRLLFIHLSEHLASYGFVVMAVEHIGTAMREGMMETAGIGSTNNIESLYYRPSDVMHTITFADDTTAGSGPLANMIDTERIAVWGHSTGGTTVFQASGARVDFEALSTWCADKEDDEFAAESCQFLGHEDEIAALYGEDLTDWSMLPALWDTRVDALVAVSPGGELHAFGDAGIAEVSIPTLLLQGTGDPFVSPEYNALWAYDQISSESSTLVMFADAGHLVFMDCPPIFAEFCGYDAVWDVSRVADLRHHFTTAFLLAELYGDEDAAAALATENVQFPGITYETTGF